MNANKEITTFWQGWAATACFGLLAFLLWAVCTAALYLCFRCGKIPLWLGLPCAAGLGVQITNRSLKRFRR